MVHLNEMRSIFLLILQLGSLFVAEAMYDIVNVKIENGNEIIELNWKRTRQNLANKNLPIWLAETDKEPQLMSQVMEQIGDFITYHDVEKSSAAVYVARCNCFYGIIDTRFYLYGLPLNCLYPDYHHKVGDGIVFMRNKDVYGRRFHDAPEDWIRNVLYDHEIQFINELIEWDNSIPENSNGLHSGTLPLSSCPVQQVHNAISTPAQVVDAPPQHTKILHPEILVVITHDIYLMFMEMSMKKNFQSLVVYYIIYFNAIDMLFSKLVTNDIAIRINMAGLLIETEFGIFPFHSHLCRLPRHQESFTCQDGHTALQTFPQYINKYRNIFVEDSYDFFFILTRFQIQDESGELVSGKSTPSSDIFARKTLQRPDVNVLGSIVEQGGGQSDYVVGTRQIAHLMNIFPSKETGQLRSEGIQCKAIMQSGETSCRHCLTWTTNSQNQLRRYVRFNLNHCFLLNFPRSLSPYGQPVFSLNPEDQCICYNHPVHTLNPFYMMSIPADGCNKQIECTHLQIFLVLPLPVDGTPCGADGKVCWRRECVQLRQGSNGHQ